MRIFIVLPLKTILETPTTYIWRFPMGHDHGHEAGEAGHTGAHEHNQAHESEPGYDHSGNPVVDWLQHFLSPHSHGHQQAALDPNLATDRGMWALKISF